MIIAVADVSSFGETEELVDFISECISKDVSSHKIGWVVIGSVIGATSERMLDRAIRSLPVNRLGDGLL